MAQKKCVIHCFLSIIIYRLIRFSRLYSTYSSLATIRNDHQKKKIKAENEDVALRDKHRACFSSGLFEIDDKSRLQRYVNLTKVGKYVLLGKNVTDSVRYDQQCPWMRDRYNCAKKITPEYGSSASDWKLTLQQNAALNSGSEQCNLWDLINEIGGPTGVAERLVERRHVTDFHNPQEPEERHKLINVVMLGNSFLRQPFEALVCGWFDDITYSRLQKYARFDFSLASVEKLKGKNLQTKDAGIMEEIPQSIEDESRYGQRKEFYAPGVEVPISFYDYNDSIGVVEFGKKIRFYYVFRLELYADAMDIFEQKLELNPKDVDVLIFNNKQEKSIVKNDELKSIFEASGAWKRRIIWPYHTFQYLQIRDIKRWFGADNPWITSPPDIHACMPGAPDDEGNLILYLLYVNANLNGLTKEEGKILLKDHQQQNARKNKTSYLSLD